MRPEQAGVSSGELHDRIQDPPPGLDDPHHGSADFRASGASSIADRHFFDSTANLERAYLHLHGPSIAPVTHADSMKQIAADGAKGTEVGVAVAVDARNEPGGQPISESLLGRERPRIDAAEDAGADDEISAALGNRLEQARNLRRIIGTVRVHEYDDFDVRCQLFQRAGTRGTIAALFDAHDHRAALPGNLRSAIAAPVVADDDIAHERAIDLRQQRADGGFFVESGNDGGDDH